MFFENAIFCLLSTSDAADNMHCVDFGGRGIIKKKKNKQTSTILNSTNHKKSTCI